jgi:hypothetical protein
VREDLRSRLMDVEIRMDGLRCTAAEYPALTMTLLVPSVTLSYHNHKY